MFDRVKKIIYCPFCSQKIRLPAVFNKTLRISCQNCQREFDVRVESPLLKLFSQKTFRSFISEFKNLPRKTKLLLIVFSLLIIAIFTALFRLLFV